MSDFSPAHTVPYPPYPNADHNVYMGVCPECDNEFAWSQDHRITEREVMLHNREVHRDSVGTARQEAIADPNPDKSTCVKTGRDNRTPENLCAVLSSEGEVEAAIEVGIRAAEAAEQAAFNASHEADAGLGLSTLVRIAFDAAFRSVSSGKGEG